MTGFGLVTLINVQRGRDKGLSSSEAFKSALLGQMLAGDNVATNFILTDRFISRELSAKSNPTTDEPAVKDDKKLTFEDCDLGLRRLNSRISEAVKKKGGKQSNELIRQIGEMFAVEYENICGTTPTGGIRLEDPVHPEEPASMHAEGAM